MNRYKRNYSAFLSVVIISIGFVFPSVLSGAESLPKEVLRYADMVLFNGKVLTADKSFSIAEAVAVRDGKIMATGSTTNILNMADQNTRRIDLEERTVIPGLIDTHSHQFDYAMTHWRGDLATWEPNLKDFIPRYIRGESVQDIMEKIRHLMTTLGPGQWTLVLVTPGRVGRVVNSRFMLPYQGVIKGCECRSKIPGITNRPPRSIVSVSSPTNASISVFKPIARKIPSLIATASAQGWASLTV